MNFNVYEFNCLDNHVFKGGIVNYWDFPEYVTDHTIQIDNIKQQDIFTSIQKLLQSINEKNLYLQMIVAGTQVKGIITGIQIDLTKNFVKIKFTDSLEQFNKFEKLEHIKINSNVICEYCLIPVEIEFYKEK